MLGKSSIDFHRPVCRFRHRDPRFINCLPAMEAIIRLERHVRVQRLRPSSRGGAVSGHRFHFRARFSPVNDDARS